ncbi:uncharacterized protein LOC131154825 isoform X2 [Malania oleifera]|uniref:uncharacterized protein LOC131154825 isoform X2 n=1 Tax=Malania oleifera TaxID=397392 RepID=UPI0025AE6EBE|nr:uncharacterized protein LOC131154825 isoform X2 [Malania oleifera]
MAQEDHPQRLINSTNSATGVVSGSSGGAQSHKSSKKQKQKKIPQRGLGVAQLEKIRLEEQKKDAAVRFSSPSSISISPPTCSSFLPLPLPNYSQSHSSSSIPFPPPSPTSLLPDPNSQLKLAPLIPNIDIEIPNLNSVQLPSLANGWSPVPAPNHGNVSKSWNYEYSLEGGENRRLDPGLAFRGNLPYETSSNWSLPFVMPRPQPPCQQPSPGKVSSATSVSPALNFHSEPPSNQSYCENYNTPICQEGEKMVGWKRSYPFCLDNPPGSPSHCKFPTSIHSISRSDEPGSCGNGGTFNFEPGNPIREGPSCSASTSEMDSKKGTEENGILDGDFLTLAPPTTSPFPSSNSKPPHASTPYTEFSEFELLHFQGSREDSILRPNTGGSIQQPLFYNFLPPAKSQISQAASHTNNCERGGGGGGGGESVDLNLKL